MFTVTSPNWGVSPSFNMNNTNCGPIGATPWISGQPNSTVPFGYNTPMNGFGGFGANWSSPQGFGFNTPYSYGFGSQFQNSQFCSPWSYGFNKPYGFNGVNTPNFTGFNTPQWVGGQNWSTPFGYNTPSWNIPGANFGGFGQSTPFNYGGQFNTPWNYGVGSQINTPFNYGVGSQFNTPFGGQFNTPWNYGFQNYSTPFNFMNGFNGFGGVGAGFNSIPFGGFTGFPYGIQNFAGFPYGYQGYNNVVPNGTEVSGQHVGQNVENDIKSKAQQVQANGFFPGGYVHPGMMQVSPIGMPVPGPMNSACCTPGPVGVQREAA